jgi:competence protein ComGC
MMKRQDGFSLSIILLVILVIVLSATLVYVFLTKTSNQETNKTKDSTIMIDTSQTKSSGNSTNKTDTDNTKASVLFLVKSSYDKYFDAMKSSDASVWTSGRAEFEKSVATELTDKWGSATVVMVDPILCIQSIPNSSYLKYSDVTLNSNTATIVVTGVFNIGTQYASESPISVTVNTLTNKITSITCG